MSQIPPTHRPDPPEDKEPSPRQFRPNRIPGKHRAGRRWLAFAVVAIAGTALLAWLASRYPGSLESRDTMAGFVRWVAILVLVTSGVLASGQLRFGKAVRDLAIWAAVVAALIAVYGFRSELTMLGSRVLGELEPSRGRQQATGALEFRRAGDGHFYVEAGVNGLLVRFLVDTGASDIVLSPTDARRLGFSPSSLTFDRIYETANGIGRGAPIVLDRIGVGPIAFRDVSATVNAAPMPESLLGLGFLDRLSGYEVHGDSLIFHP